MSGMKEVDTIMEPTIFRVHRVQKDTYDTFTLELQPTNGKKPFHFSPGQFNMLYVFGKGEVPISISGDPGRSQSLVHTTRAVGTVTKALQQLKVGGELAIRGPFGTAWPLDKAKGKDVVIIAGGIGLAPVRPVIYEILARRKDFKNALLLLGARTPEDLLYTKEFSIWKKKGLDVRVTVDRGSKGWKGKVGLVTTLIPGAPFDPQNAVAMICGPEIMMKFTVIELQKLGMPEKSIYISMERNMKCGIGFCGHCQCAPVFICKDGPVFSFDRMKNWFGKREV